MGEVYRARDPRLDRAVAIKILPAELSADADHLHRFEREARSASALNHPNIVTIYELAQDGSTHFIAMELIEGQTLRQLLASGALPIRKAIEIASQVAEGLAKAHEAGIAHRDLKPDNLMISSDGFVKILDFGLAKATTRAAEHQENARNLCVAHATRRRRGHGAIHVAGVPRPARPAERLGAGRIGTVPEGAAERDHGRIGRRLGPWTPGNRRS